MLIMQFVINQINKDDDDDYYYYCKHTVACDKFHA